MYKWMYIKPSINKQGSIARNPVLLECSVYVNRCEWTSMCRAPAGASPLRGSSPPRPPKPPGSTKFRQMLKAMIHRRPSNVDLEKVAELEKEAGGEKKPWMRSPSHGALVDLDASTGIWNSKHQTLTHNPSTNSLSSQKSSEKWGLASYFSTNLTVLHSA